MQSPASAPILHPLFLHTPPAKPLSADVFRYTVRVGHFHLDFRTVLCRDSLGSVYLGICESPAPFGEPSPALACAMIWDVAHQVFRLRQGDTPESATPVEGGVLGYPFRPVVLAGGGVPQSHLGYRISPAANAPGVLYSPALELAMIHKEALSNGISRESVVQSIQPGAPDLSAFHCEKLLA